MCAKVLAVTIVFHTFVHSQCHILHPWRTSLPTPFTVRATISHNTWEPPAVLGRTSTQPTDTLPSPFPDDISVTPSLDSKKLKPQVPVTLLKRRLQQEESSSWSLRDHRSLKSLTPTDKQGIIENSVWVGVEGPTTNKNGSNYKDSTTGTQAPETTPIFILEDDNIPQDAIPSPLSGGNSWKATTPTYNDGQTDRSSGQIQPFIHVNATISTSTVTAEDPVVLATPEYFIDATQPSARNKGRQYRWLGLDGFFRVLQMGPDTVPCVGIDGRHGMCLLKSQCQMRGGTPSDSTCSYGYGTCCVVLERECGGSTSVNRTYWVSGAPEETDVVSTGGTCTLQIHKADPQVCYIRLDLITFKLSPPKSGDCKKDHLIISGHNLNAIIPKLCGENAGQHMYIDVDTVPGPIELRMSTVGSGFQRSWDILITQISCSGPSGPPGNCLQYFTGTMGTISSFNYLNTLDSMYLNNLNYASCIRKEAGFCSIVYRNKPNTITRTNFGIANYNISPKKFPLNKVFFNTSIDPRLMKFKLAGLATSTVPVSEAGVGVINCPDDYLVLAATRLCGDRLNDGTVEPKPTEDAPITDSTNGPFILQFHSDKESNGRGFQITYQQHPC